MYAGNFYLNPEQMTVNAQYIINYLCDRGWTKNAVCGMLGNMQSESTINPGIWQSLDEGNTNLGYGLVQWTPATKYLDWCTTRGYTPSEMNSNLLRILDEVSTNTQWGNDSLGNSPPYDFTGFTHSQESAYQLGVYFFLHYERALIQSEEVKATRGTQSQTWYDNLVYNGNTGGTGGRGYISEHSFTLFNYMRKRRLVIK